MDFEFTRGDTQFIRFKLKDASGEPLQLELTDNMYFTVKTDANSTKVLLQKKFPEDIEYQDGYYVFTITSEDTSNMAYGDYQYDIEVKSNDVVKTIGQGTITLTEEITHRRDE